MSEYTMTTPTQRTPQQASIEAREAREAWERGEPIEWSEDNITWKVYGHSHGLTPALTSPHAYWRVASKPTPPVITPGKWRTRKGEVVEVTKRVSIPNESPYPFESKTNRLLYCADGRVYQGQNDIDDLLTRAETKWRPWNLEEVPLGREIHFKQDHTRRELIFGNHYRDVVFNEWELLLPDGTYSPCGVEEVVG